MTTPLERLEQRAKEAETRARIRRAQMQRQLLDQIAKSRRNTGKSGAPMAASRPVSAEARRSGPAARRNAMRRDELIAECRQAYATDATAAALVARYVDLLVGDGPTITVVGHDDATARLDRWVEGSLQGDPVDPRGRLSFVEMLRMIPREWQCAGDVLVVRVEGGAIQLYESELVSSGYGPPSHDAVDDMTTMNGVVLDATRRPVQYIVGQYTEYGFVDTSDPIYVDAQHAWLSVNPRFDTPSAVRGEPTLRTLLGRIDRAERYEEHTAIAAQNATYLGLLGTTDNPAALQSTLLGASESDPAASGWGGSTMAVTLDPSYINMVPPNTRIEQVKPEYPVSAYDAYMAEQRRAMCAAMGIPQFAVWFDPRDYNLATAKGALAIAARGLHADQAALARVCEWVLRWKLEQWEREGAIASGAAKATINLQFPDRVVLDQSDEVATWISAIQNHLATRDQATRTLGFGRGRDVVEARAEEQRFERDAGIVSPVVPGSVPGGSQHHAPQESVRLAQ